MFLRRIALPLSAGTLAAGLSAAAAGTAYAVVPPDPNWNEIISVFDHNAGNCWPREIDWIMDTGPGINNIMLRDPVSYLCLAAADFSDSNGTPLIATTCNPNDLSQVWTLG